MSPPSPPPVSGRPESRPPGRPGWARALAVVLTTLAAMFVAAALGLWAAGAADLPDGAFGRVAAATVVTSVGGSVELDGNAGALAQSRAGLNVLPLSVTLTGALVLGAGFLRPLRNRAVAGAGGPAGWAGRIALLWLLALIALAYAARQTFAVNLGEGVLNDISGLFGAEPRVGFTTNVPLTVLFGLLWLAGVLVLALLVASGPPVPERLARHQRSVRPAAQAMVALLLVYVVIGVVVALVTAATRGQVAERFAVILLGMPNVVWPALTLGLGAGWYGRVDGPFGLPMPHVLDQALRTPQVSTVNVGTLADYDSRSWWLVPVAAVLLLAVAFWTAARSPAHVRAWQHAVRMAVALALTVLMMCLLGRISAHYGLSLFGIGDLGGGLSGELFLKPRLSPAVGLGALWGLVMGFLGALAARPLHRRRDEDRTHPGTTDREPG